MEEKHIVSGRGTTYYWIEKRDEPGAKTLVFLPGLTANHHLFDAQVPYFAKQHTVLVWDAPAHGKSRPYQDFSYPHLAEELKTIFAAEHIHHAFLVGQSAGGFVAQSFAVSCPWMVEGIVMIGSCPYGTGYYSRSDLFWLKQIEWMANLFPDRLLRNTMAGMCGATGKGRENMLQMLKDYRKDELCHLMLLGFAGFIPEIRDIKLECPVWLTVGERDRTGKIRRYNKLWHEKMGYPLYVIEGAAHNANVDCPEQVNELIERFMQTVSAKQLPTG